MIIEACDMTTSLNTVINADFIKFEQSVLTLGFVIWSVITCLVTSRHDCHQLYQTRCTCVDVLICKMTLLTSFFFFLCKWMQMNAQVTQINAKNVLHKSEGQKRTVRASITQTSYHPFSTARKISVSWFCSAILLLNIWW